MQNSEEKEMARGADLFIQRLITVKKQFLFRIINAFSVLYVYAYVPDPQNECCH